MFGQLSHPLFKRLPARHARLLPLASPGDGLTLQPNTALARVPLRAPFASRAKAVLRGVLFVANLPSHCQQRRMTTRTLATAAAQLHLPKKKRSKLLPAIVLASMLAVFGWAFHQHKSWLASYWREQLESAPLGEIDGLILCLGEMNRDGLAALVDCLASPRSEVREAALARLKRTIAQWSQSPSEVGDCNYLAERLALASANFSGWSSEQSAALAEWLLQLNLPSGVDRFQLTAHCQQVFRNCRWQPGHLGRSKPVAADKKNLPSPLPGNPPGGKSPPTSVSAAATEVPNSGENLVAANVEVPMPTLLVQTADPEGAKADEAMQEAIRSSHSAREAAANSRMGEGATPTVTWDLVELKRRNTASLLSMLRDGDPQANDAAEFELQRRGFRPSHLELARRLADPNPEVRRLWVEQVPRLTSIDPRPWLWWLATDSDAEVRLTALSLLATTNDLATHRQLIEAARIDGDPRIRELGDRLMAGRQQTQR